MPLAVWCYAIGDFKTYLPKKKLKKNKNVMTREKKNLLAIPTLGTDFRNNKVYPKVEWFLLTYSAKPTPNVILVTLSYHASPCLSKCLLFFLYSPSGFLFCFPFFLFSPLSFYFFKTEFEFTRAVLFKNFFCVLVFLFIYLNKRQLITKNWDSS